MKGTEISKGTGKKLSSRPMYFGLFDLEATLAWAQAETVDGTKMIFKDLNGTMMTESDEITMYNYHPYLSFWSATSVGGGLKMLQGNLSLKMTHIYRSIGLGTDRIFAFTFLYMIFDCVKSMISITSMIWQFYYYEKSQF